MILSKNVWKLAGRICLVSVCCDPTLYNEYIAMVETGHECQLTDYMSSHGKNCYGGLLRGRVVPGKFLLVLHNTLPVEDETSNALVVVWFGNGARSVPRNLVRHRLERILMRLVNTSSLHSRLHQSRKRVFPRHPCFEPVFSCCLCQCCTQNSLFLQSLHFAQNPQNPPDESSHNYSRKSPSRMNYSFESSESYPCLLPAGINPEKVSARMVCVCRFEGK